MQRQYSFYSFFYRVACMLVFFTCSLSLHAHVGHTHIEDGFTDFKQPDGKVIKLKFIGNNSYTRTETSEGYTVVYNAEDKTYYYAKLNRAKDGFEKTNRKADQKASKGLKKHLSLGREARKKHSHKQFTLHIEEQNKRWNERVKGAKKRRAQKLKKQQDQGIDIRASLGNNSSVDQMLSAQGIASSDINASSIVGAQKGLTILIQFPADPDEPVNGAQVDFPTTADKIERFCNEIGYSDDGNSGSVRDYFMDQSNNLMDYTMSVTTIVTLPNPRNYYNYSDYPTNTVLKDSGLAGNELIADAIEVLKEQSFSFDGLTTSDGSVTTTNVLFAGETSGVWSEGLWPHAFGIYPSATGVVRPVVEVDGVMTNIFRYQVTNISSSSVTIGTFCHELGHSLLSFPDLYDYGGDSSGIGRHGLMASGNFSNSGRTPSPINLYFKDIIGWANLTDIRALDYHNLDLPATGNVGYRIINPADTDEYFVVENRSYAGGAEGGDKWASSVPDQGIMIWHIDDAVTGNNDQGMTLNNHYQVSLEQQDGEFDLEADRGADGTDAYDSSSPEFNDTNTPNANWWDGSTSGVKINVNSSAGASMNVTFGTFVPSTDIVILSPNGGENWFPSNHQEITWTSTLGGDVKIELLKGGVIDTVISSSTPNDDGSFTWTVPAGQTLDDDYTIRISSLLDIENIDTSNSNFSIIALPL